MKPGAADDILALADVRARRAVRRLGAMPRDIAAAARLALRQRAARRAGEDLQRFDRALPLVCVVTGLPKSGTTLLSQLLNGHDRIAAGFECGILLSNVVDYDRIEPYWEWLLHEGKSWGAREADRTRLTGARSYAELYCILNEIKGQGHSDAHLRAVFSEADLIFDKTPAYIHQLPRMMGRIGVPFVVTIKSPQDAIASSRKYGLALGAAMRSYDAMLLNVERAMRRYPGRVIPVRYEALASRPVEVMDAVQRFVGLGEPVRLDMARYNARMRHRYNPAASFQTDEIRYVPAKLELQGAEAERFQRFAGRSGAWLDRICPADL